MFDIEKLLSAINQIIEILESKKSLSNLELLRISRNEGIGAISNGIDDHFVHELVEVAVNIKISQKDFQIYARENDEREVLEQLARIEEKLPVQSWRSDEQIRLQQFSTPPPVAFLMTKILRPSISDSVLEPSAGTGSLAIWLKSTGCEVRLNEISKRRRALLELQGFQPTGYDAEFLDDVLPEKIAFDGVLMNPPFSSSGGRTKNNDSSFGHRHIRSAISRLKTGGRLVALVGTEGGIKTNKSQRFWSEISADNDLKAFIHLPKNAFYKYGTRIKTSIVCLTKGKLAKGVSGIEKRKSVPEINCATLKDCLPFLEIFDRLNFEVDPEKK